MGRVNYKCVEEASENARSRGTGTRTGTKQGEEERRRRFWAERVFGGRTRWRWISSVRPHPPRRRPLVLPHPLLGAYSFPCGRRTGSTEQLHPRRRRRPRRRPPPLPPPSFLSLRSAPFCERARTNVTLDHLFRCA